MEIVLNVLGLYLSVGILAIITLDTVTGRVRKRTKKASSETQLKLTNAGSFIGIKMAIAFTIFALWIFWPFAIYSALKRSENKE